MEPRAPVSCRHQQFLIREKQFFSIKKVDLSDESLPLLLLPLKDDLNAQSWSVIENKFFILLNRTSVCVTELN